MSEIIDAKDDFAEKRFDDLTAAFREIYTDWKEGCRSDEEFRFVRQQICEDAIHKDFTEAEIATAYLRAKQQYEIN